MATVARTSCGVLVTDGTHLLLGQAGLSARWDIPKGLAEPGEPLPAAAARELAEETSLSVDPAALTPLGLHRYLPGKQLALFAWRVPTMPDPAALRCTSLFQAPNGRMVPELTRFAVMPWADALTKVGKNLARVLSELGPIPSG